MTLIQIDGQKLMQTSLINKITCVTLTCKKYIIVLIRKHVLLTCLRRHVTLID
jgi:hypothetical protein